MEMVASNTFLCDTGDVAIDVPPSDTDRAAGRKTLSIRADVAAVFKQVCKSKAVGRSMDDTATRLIEWFNRQRAFVKTAVVNDVDEGMEHAYITALRDLADELEGKATGEETNPPPPPSEPDEDPEREGSKDAGSRATPPAKPKRRGRSPARDR